MMRCIAGGGLVSRGEEEGRLSRVSVAEVGEWYKEKNTLPKEGDVLQESEENPNVRRKVLDQYVFCVNGAAKNLEEMAAKIAQVLPASPNVVVECSYGKGVGFSTDSLIDGDFPRAMKKGTRWRVGSAAKVVTVDPPVRLILPRLRCAWYQFPDNKLQRSSF